MHLSQRPQAGNIELTKLLLETIPLSRQIAVLEVAELVARSRLRARLFGILSSRWWLQ
jgi:hypothetical protein